MIMLPNMKIWLKPAAKKSKVLSFYKHSTKFGWQISKRDVKRAWKSSKNFHLSKCFRIFSSFNSTATLWNFPAYFVIQLGSLRFTWKQGVQILSNCVNYWVLKNGKYCKPSYYKYIHFKMVIHVLRKIIFNRAWHRETQLNVVEYF